MALRARQARGKLGTVHAVKQDRRTPLHSRRYVRTLISDQNGTPDALLAGFMSGAHFAPALSFGPVGSPLSGSAIFPPLAWGTDHASVSVHREKPASEADPLHQPLAIRRCAEFLRRASLDCIQARV